LAPFSLDSAETDTLREVGT